MSIFSTVKNYLIDLDYDILDEDPGEELLIVSNEDAGVTNLIVDCEDPILIIEYPLFKIKADNSAVYKELLAKNRDIIHGAFALAEENMLIFRDTLQLENLDLNELEGTLNSLEILLAEFSDRLITLSK
jgi:hypothetical protein